MDRRAAAVRPLPGPSGIPEGRRPAGLRLGARLLVRVDALEGAAVHADAATGTCTSATSSSRGRRGGLEFTSADEDVLVLSRRRRATAIANARTDRNDQRARADREARSKPRWSGVVVFDRGAANPCGSTGRCGAVTHEPRRPCSDRRSFRPSPRRQARRITSSSSSSDRRPSTMPSTVTAGLPPSARKPSVHSTSRHAAQRAKPSSRTTEGAMSASDRRSSSQEQLRTWARQPYADAAQEAAPSPVRPPSRPSQVGTPRL